MLYDFAICIMFHTERMVQDACSIILPEVENTKFTLKYLGQGYTCILHSIKQRNRRQQFAYMWQTLYFGLTDFITDTANSLWSNEAGI